MGAWRDMRMGGERCPRRPRWGALAALALLCVLWAAPAALAQQAKAPPLVSEEATVTLDKPAQAVAISADESILAVAEPADKGQVRVVLYDRPSRAPLGVLLAAVGQSPRLRFSPTEDLLAVAGSRGIQLWELPISGLDPTKVLARKYLRWAVAFKPEGAPGGVSFGRPPDQVYWSRGGALYRRGTSASASYDGKPVWKLDDTGARLRGFTFLPEAGGAALLVEERKALTLLDVPDLQVQQQLQGHRFPVVGAVAYPGGPLRSLDAGNNLIQWNALLQPETTIFLEQLPRGFGPLGLRTLGDAYLLVPGKNGRAAVVEARSGRLAADFPAPGPEQVAASPTGRYILVGAADALHLYGFTRPASPLAYVRHLRSLKAEKMAQSYVRLMDESTISPQLKADLLAELSREPPERRLKEYLSRLSLAVQGGDRDRIRYWAEQVLAVRPDQPDAVAALRQLRQLQEQEVMQQARDAYDRGENRLAISMLSSGIAEESTLYPQAAELIRRAEARRSVETALEQAREKLNLGDYPAARALVNEALRKDAKNASALALQREIDQRAGGFSREVVAGVLGGITALLLVGFVLHRYRRRLAPVLDKVRLDEQPPPPPGAGRMHREAPEPERVRAGAGTRQTGRGTPAGPRADRSQATRRKVVEDLIDKTEQMIRLARQADVYQQFTAFLMELEAELHAVNRRLADASAELGPVHQRLKEMVAQLRGLQFRRAPAEARASAPPPAEEPSYYELLNLSPEASTEDIRTAYHRLIKQYHPDLHNSSQFDWVRSEAERMTRRIRQAYEVLSDEGARQKYDRELRSRRRSAP